jgi:RimJ/RimL family protein N-acetyltransferase
MAATHERVFYPYVVHVPIYALNDGTEVRIRPIRSDDGERLQASHARLSPESRYRRFLAAKPQLTPADARYLVDLDGCDHFALVATLDDEEGSIVAVTRFIRIPGAPDVAEFAIVVGDAYQGQGLATEMTAQLARAAARRGITRFRAAILADNLPVRKLLVGLTDGVPRELRTGSTSELEVDLPCSVVLAHPEARRTVALR